MGAETVEIERGKLLMGVNWPSREHEAFRGEQPAVALPLAIPWRQLLILEKRELLAILLKASLAPAALSVLLTRLHVSDDRRVERSDCFMGPAERGAPIPFSWPGALFQAEDLQCAETRQMLQDFRDFKGRGGTRNNKTKNDKHFCSKTG